MQQDHWCRDPLHLTVDDVRLLYQCSIAVWACPACGAMECGEEDVVGDTLRHRLTGLGLRAEVQNGLIFIVDAERHEDPPIISPFI